MLTTPTPTATAPHGTVRVGHDARWAVLSGVLGLIANALLIAFFTLAEPFSGHPSPYGWLGTVNDVFVAAQFATLVPVATALHRRLPPTAAVRALTVAVLIALAVAVALQGLLVAGLLPFEVQILLVTPAFLVVFGWVLGTSAVAHRRRLLSPRLTSFGLLVGTAYPIALVLTLAGYGIGSALGLGWAPAVPGLLLGGLAWVALPVWPLLSARLVFAKGRS